MFCNFFTFWLFFFFPTFFQLFLFFFFPRKSLKSTHSLDFLGRKKKKTAAEKKNTIFTHSVDFCPKSANFKLFRGNKKIRSLWGGYTIFNRQKWGYFFQFLSTKKFFWQKKKSGGKFGQKKQILGKKKWGYFFLWKKN